MTDDRIPLAELLAKAGDQDFLRSVAESVLRIIMETVVEGLIGGGRFERSADRATWRNSLPRTRSGAYRERGFGTRFLRAFPRH